MTTLADVQAALAAVLAETPSDYAMPAPAHPGWSAETCLGSQVVKKLGGFIGTNQDGWYFGPHTFAYNACDNDARVLLACIIRHNDAGLRWHDAPRGLEPAPAPAESPTDAA